MPWILSRHIKRQVLNEKEVKLMSNLVKSIFIIILITLLQLAIYALFLKPIITTWGASRQEVTMPMAGDNPTLTITATRAILINAPKSEVWQWLIQLGADRGGFYSYTFIEEAMGYKTRPQTLTEPEFQTIAVGDAGLTYTNCIKRRSTSK